MSSSAKTTNQALDFTGLWQWKKLALFHIIAAILVASFFWGPVRGLWLALDHAAFYALNGSVAGDGFWAWLAAFANSKLYDVLSAAFLVLILLGFAFYGWFRGDRFDRRLAAMIFVGLYMLVMTYTRRKYGVFEFDRDSPSRVLEPFYDLRETFPDMRPKTSAGSTFPGVHGVSMVIYIGLLWHFAGRRLGLLALAAAPLFVVPRIIGGAHWLSDIVVGGGFYGLMVIAWALYTPFGAWACRKLLRPVQWGQRLLQKIAPQKLKNPAL